MNPLRALPSVDALLAASSLAPLLERFRRDYIADACRRVLERHRRRLRETGGASPGSVSDSGILDEVRTEVEESNAPHLRRVVNATGTLLHTNLGRAVLSGAAVAALVEAARHPVNVEYDLESGRRGRREAIVEGLLTELTGAEAATVVNNNAAAVLLALNTLAAGKDVVVSRGELVEIGGSFRVPAIMQKSGALLKEVGTTNRTHPDDYARAIDASTALLLKVHTSNYRIVGFSSEVELSALVEIGRRHGVPVMEDLGSGAMLDLSRHGLPKEPVVAERVAAGADVVTFSGDKVLGGPQAGLIVGRRDFVAQMAANPLHRALRCDKLTLAALEATLCHYREASVVRDIPTLAAFTRPIDEIEAVGVRVVPLLQAALGEGYEIRLDASTSQVGSGALPIEELPTRVVAIRHPRISVDTIAAAFRAAHPPILGRIKDDVFLLDVRTVLDPHDLVPRWRGAPPGL